MLNRIRYKNFKSWRDTGDLLLGSVSGFFGANSSGKTSILQGLLMLKQSTESSDRNQVFDFGDESKYVDLGSMEEAIFQHRAATMSIEMDWSLPKKLEVENPEARKSTLFSSDKMGFDVNVDFLEKRGDQLKDMVYRLGGDLFSYRRKNGGSEFSLDFEGSGGFTFKRQDGRKWPLPPPFKFYGFPDQVTAYHRNAGFLTDFQLEIERFFQNVFYLGPLRENPKRQYTWKGAEPEDMGRRGQRAVDAILVSDSRGKKLSFGKGKPKRKLSEHIAQKLKELGLIHSFEIRKIEGSSFYQVWVKRNEASSEVLITDVGFGVSQILPVLTLCFYVPEGSVILIEQPEIHLHPSVQAGLADIFIEAAKTRNVQIIIESHSEHLLRRLQRRLAEKVIESEQVSLFFCESAMGESTIHPLDIDLFGVIKNWPKDFFGDEMGELAATNLARIQRLQNL